MLNITRLYDQPAWAYYFITRDMAKYSTCRITSASYDNFDYKLQDIIIIPSPNIYYQKTAIEIPNECKKRGIKVIGQYSGEVNMVYSHADLIVAISPQLYLYAKEAYKDKGIPVIFLPESIDTNYFQPTTKSRAHFNPGWGGGAHKPIKRTHLFQKAICPIKIKSDHGKEYFKEGKTQEHMKEFYSSIDCFVSVSQTECMSRSILEAMACGLPVIATDVGGTRLLIPDEWLIPVFPEDLCIEEMNKRLKQLKDSYELRDGIGRINRAWAENVFSWEVNMPIWDEVFYYLKQGNISKIEEIGESVIEPFKKFFEPCEKYTEQIKKFSKGGTDRTTRTSSDLERWAHASKNLIDDLRSYTGKYWIAGETCLNTINHNIIKTNPGKIFLGTSNENDKVKLELFLRNLGAEGIARPLRLRGLEIHVLIEEVKDTKDMILYNFGVKVPSPVVPYLYNRFGHAWRDK